MATRSIKTAALSLFGAVALAACGPSEPPTAGAPPQAERLSEAQYRQSISDIFGPDIKVAGRFEPGIRKNGLLAVGDSVIAVSPAGFEQYDSMARGIASQIVDEKHRQALIPCTPIDSKKADAACARQTLGKYGRLLFRRPLTETELAGPAAMAGTAADTVGDFYTGLTYGLAQLLDSPNFLFRKDAVELDPDNQGKFRLTAFSKASRLSFFLWNAPPDDELLRAAESGEIQTRSGLAKQVDRMLASPRLEAGVRAFFIDFLDFDKFDALAKDPMIYPVFSTKVARDAEEQTLRTITDALITRDGDYRDIFTTRRTFMTRNLGIVYRVRVASEHGWEPYEFPAGDQHAGILTQLSFTELHSHPGRSSATLRGKAVREILLCEQVPMPPANVNFTVVQETNNPVYKTARERLTAHRTDPTCAGCHKLVDPIGLGLENFDGAGAYRDLENGAPIDASGDIDGIHFSNAAELGKAIHDDPAAVSCLVESVFRYAAGRDFDKGEKEWRGWIAKQFVADGYKLPALLRRIATSKAFYAVTMPEQRVKEAER
jgi:hypothetical protein